MADRWRSVHLDEIEAISVVSDTLVWRPIRRTLDVGAFGINAYVAQNAGDDVVERHDESALGHEEVYVVLTGRATFRLEDEELDAPAARSCSSEIPASVDTRAPRSPEPRCSQ